MSDLPGVSEISRVEIKPGDKIVVRLGDGVKNLTAQSLAYLKHRVTEALDLDETNDVLILGPGMSLSVYAEVGE